MRRAPTETVVALAGEIDMSTVQRLATAVDEILGGDTPTRVVLDMAGVTFCDSQGLSALIGLNRDVSAGGSRLVFVNVGDFMGRLLDITGLRAAFDVVDSA